MSGNSKASLLKNVGVVSISLKQGDFPLLVAPGCTKTEEEPRYLRLGAISAQIRTPGEARQFGELRWRFPVFSWSH